MVEFDWIFVKPSIRLPFVHNFRDTDIQHKNKKGIKKWRNLMELHCVDDVVGLQYLFVRNLKSLGKFISDFVVHSTIYKI